jgi:predicted ABC-type ATPase
VDLVYFWVESADVAVARVAQRVRQGGHHVPEATIRQRYRRGLRNFFDLYRPIADIWRVYDNTLGGPTRAVAEGLAGHEFIANPEIWQRMLREGAS